MNLFAFNPKPWRAEVTPTKLNTTMARPADVLYWQALRRMPDLQPTYVYLPTQPERKFRVSGPLIGQWTLWETGNSVSFDQHTGQLVQLHRIAERPLSERLEALFFPLHVGNYGGWPVKILYALIGLTPDLLAITGFLLWWRRTQKPNRPLLKVSKMTLANPPS